MAYYLAKLSLEGQSEMAYLAKLHTKRWGVRPYGLVCVSLAFPGLFVQGQAGSDIGRAQECFQMVALLVHFLCPPCLLDIDIDRAQEY